MPPDDASGYAQFVATSYPALVRTAYLLVGDRGQAEDLVQSALVQTYQAWTRLRDPAAAFAYTRTTAIRLGGRWSRRRWHGEHPTDQTRIEWPSRGTDGGFAAVDLAVDVRAALGRLPWSQRVVLVLRYLDDLSEAQTAEVLGCSLGTVKSRASRGLVALRAAGLLETGTENAENAENAENGAPDGR